MDVWEERGPRRQTAPVRGVLSGTVSSVPDPLGELHEAKECNLFTTGCFFSIQEQ